MTESRKKSSILFSPLELEVMIERSNGDYSDKSGVFSNRIKPKIIEILFWSDPKNKRILKKALKQLRNRYVDI